MLIVKPHMVGVTDLLADEKIRAMIDEVNSQKKAYVIENLSQETMPDIGLQKRVKRKGKGRHKNRWNNERR